MKRNWRWLGIGAAGGLAVYYLVPYLGMQLANFGVVRQSSGALPEMGLTFDDGPDPACTPAILDALRAHGAHATFFVVGERALAYPELIARIQREGHERASHGMPHRHAWLRSPWAVAADLRASVATLQRLASLRPTFFRPPHGGYTAATWWVLRRERLTAAHWSLEAHDWHREFLPEDVVERVLYHAEPGRVVVMHDGGPGGPVTAKILPQLLEELSGRGYQIKPLGQLHGLQASSPRGVLRRIWELIVDDTFDRINDVDFLTEPAYGMFRLARSRFSGPAVTLSDGRVVRPGDSVAELHVHSRRLVAAVRHNPVRAFRMVRQSITDVARMMRDNPKYRDAPLLFAVTPFHDLVDLLGFQVRDLDSRVFYLRMQAFTVYLRWLYASPASRKPTHPKMIYIERDQLLSRYLSAEVPEAVTSGN